MKFVITYSSGKTQEHTTEHETVDAFINQNFGSAWEGAQEAGITVEMVDVLPSEELDFGHSKAEKKLIAKLKKQEAKVTEE